MRQHHEDWSDQERKIGSAAHAGEILAGAVMAIALQATLSTLLVIVGLLHDGTLEPSHVAGWLSLASCGQFVWLVPAFAIGMWLRPGFAAGLALGAFVGAPLGLGLSCLAAFG